MLIHKKPNERVSEFDYKDRFSVMGKSRNSGLLENRLKRSEARAERGGKAILNTYLQNIGKRSRAKRVIEKILMIF